jgi:hypothetical protein
VRFDPVFPERTGLCGVAAMPVETRETQPLACFDKPAHPDKGGTVPITPSQSVYPSKIDTIDLAVFAMAVCPRPKAEELADHGILFESADRSQPDDGRIVC